MRLERELYHWGTKKNHKYITKVKVGDRWRYFYDQEEYNNYLNGGKKLTSKVASDVVNKVDEAKSKTKNTIDNLKKGISNNETSKKSSVIEKGKKFLNKLKKDFTITTVEKSSNGNKVTKKGKDFIISSSQEKIPKESFWGKVRKATTTEEYSGYTSKWKIR